MLSEKNIPNIFTCLNLLCGCLAIVSVFHHNSVLMAAMVFLAALFDVLDGLIARSLNAFSELGKQLDSLADMVTFGVVPGMILYHFMISNETAKIIDNPFLLNILKYFPFIVTVFGAFRLAKFNIDTRQSSSFLGLPIPAMGIFVTSFPLIIKYDRFNFAPLISNPYFIIITSIILSMLMVSEIPLFALKFKSLKWKDNKVQFTFMVLAFVLILLLNVTALPFVILLYIFISLINNFTSKRIKL